MDIKNNPFVSEIAKEIQGSKTRYYSELAAKFDDTISFAIGEPDFTTPQHIIEVAAQKLLAGYTHYAPNPGIWELRQAIAEHYNKKHPRQHLTGDNVVVTSGTQEANLLALMAILNPGDEIVVAAPSYISYIPQFLMMRVKPNYVLTHEKDRYALQMDAVEAAITEKTRAILINSPCNPTGAVLSRTALEALISIADRHKIAIISDETYSDIVFEPFSSILDVTDMTDNLVYTSGFSKSYAMTGWRLGYTITTKEVALALRYLHENNASCSNTALQYGAIEALKNGVDDVEQMRRAYERRRDLICSKLDEIDGLSYVLPEGTFYVYINIEKTGLSCIEFLEKLLDAYHVVVAPGTVFGEAGEGHIRLSYATSEENIINGMNRIASFVSSLK